jgi:hypothetical protein
MRSPHILLAGLTVLMPMVCQAQAKCPWINEATAGGILGGAVTVRVNVTDGAGGVCEFSRHRGETVHELRVSVHLMTDIPKQFPAYLAQCSPKSTPVPAVGNQAALCSIAVKGQKYEERVVGRVRDQAFVVGVSSNVRDDRSMTQEMRREKANLIAEQVAGILF